MRAQTTFSFATSTPRVPIGGEFRFSLTLRARRRQKLLIDYVMTFAGDAHRASRKVFKLKQVELGPDESVTITKAHPMRLITTRALRPGEHSISLQVNGRPRGRLRFDLVAILAAVLAIACGDAAVDKPPPLTTAVTDSVLVVFTRDEAPAAVYRAVSGSPDLPTALHALVRGPTDAERAAGIRSWFSEATATAVKSVDVDSAGHATIDFHDLRALIPGASSSAGSTMLLHELNGTLFQFPHIKSVEYRIDGSCAAFWEWLQYGCQTVVRPER